MCPSGLALHHPSADLLLQYTMEGCPTKTGRPWTVQEILEAIENGPHASAMDPEAMAQLKEETEQKLKKGQAKLVIWDDIKDNPPEQLKISPIAMIPHKLRKFQAILDLSFVIGLRNGNTMQSVNDATKNNCTRRGN